MRSAVPSRRRGGAAALAALALVALTACGSTGGQAAAGGPATATFTGLELADPVPAPRFTLTDQDGQPYDYAARTAGKAVLLFFGYTNCPDECPATMATLASALRSSPPAVQKATQVVFVTSDPARDTPARSKEWISGFGWPADSPAVALTGDIDTIYAQAARVGVPLEKPVTEPDGTVTVTHGAQVVGYDTAGKSRVAFVEGVRPADVQHDLPLLLQPAPAAAAAKGQAGMGVSAGNPRVGAVADAGGGTVAYLSLRNGSDQADTLTGVTSRSARTITLAGADGAAVPSLALPAGTPVQLEPGGAHLVLRNLAGPLAAGSTVSLRLTFAKAGPIAVTAPVVALSQGETEPHTHAEGTAEHTH